MDVLRYNRRPGRRGTAAAAVLNQDHLGILQTLPVKALCLVAAQIAVILQVMSLIVDCSDA